MARTEIVKYPNKARHALSLNRNNYQKVLDVILKYSDMVCFTVSPYLDDIDEIREDDRYQKILDSYIDSEFTKSIHIENRNESLVYFKMDYFIREFLKEKRDIFDFFDEDASINLEDIVFIGKQEIVCDTITHEHYCAVSDDIYEELTND